MTDDNSGLSQTEAAQWDAIVSSEWPVESAILTTQLSSGSAPSGEADGTAEQRFVTVYQPRRPRLAPLAVAVVALAATAWLTIQVLIPAYQGAGLAGISRSERAVEVHDLTIAAALGTITLVVAVSCIGIWAVNIPLVAARLDLNTAMVGTILLTVATSAIVAMPLGGFAVDGKIYKPALRVPG